MLIIFKLVHLCVQGLQQYLIPMQGWVLQSVLSMSSREEQLYPELHLLDLTCFPPPHVLVQGNVCQGPYLPEKKSFGVKMLKWSKW